MPRYRQGRKVPLNVYDGDEPIFQAHDAASAMKLAGLLNMGWHLTQVTYDQLQDVFAESERYWGEEDFLTRLQSEVWMLLMPRNVVVSAPDRPPRAPESREGHTGLVVSFPCEQCRPLEPDGWECTGACRPPETAEDKLVDLMGELERSVNEAKASRKRKRAELKAAYDGLCVAEGCTTPHLTAWDDGEGPLLLCERHGDELAIGFPLKPGAREVSS